MKRRTPAFPIADLPGTLPHVNISDDVDHAAVVTTSLLKLSSLKAESLTEDAHWRDLLALTDTFRTFFGSSRILAAWKELFKLHNPMGFALIPGTSRIARYGPKTSWIQAMFKFETDTRHSSGIVRLVPDKDGDWKIWVISTFLESIKSFPNVDSLDIAATSSNGALINAQSYRDCVIVGAGMAGLSIAGRLKALGVSSIAMDRNLEIGGNWTSRYASVKLHTSKESGQMPFGRTWGPEFSYFLSGDDLAKGFRAFVEQYGIDVQLDTTVTSAQWSSPGKKWNVFYTSKGVQKSIAARHLILAMGAGGQTPRMPALPNKDSYQGVVMHSVDYRSATRWQGKSGIIVGTGNTAHDIAEDMLDAGLASVTMVQRNPTQILPISYYRAAFDGIYNDRIPTEIADRVMLGGPLALGRQLALHGVTSRANQDSEYFESLERVGFKTGRICDLFHIIYERLGGHYLDVGASAKVAKGLIKIKSDSSLSEYTDSGLRFDDGSELEGDIVIFATGFEGNMRHMATKIVGEEISDQLEDFFHVDAEGEVLGAWKPIGHSGIWYTGGTIGQARFFSRFLALQIKADLEGIPFAPYTKHRSEADDVE